MFINKKTQDMSLYRLIYLVIINTKNFFWHFYIFILILTVMGWSTKAGNPTVMYLWIV